MSCRFRLVFPSTRFCPILCADQFADECVDVAGHFTEATSNYLLVSNDQCLTPWHVDFSSTTAFYTVAQGQKIFWLMVPTSSNLQLFEEWSIIPTKRLMYSDHVLKTYSSQSHHFAKSTLSMHMIQNH